LSAYPSTPRQWRSSGHQDDAVTIHGDDGNYDIDPSLITVKIDGVPVTRAATMPRLGELLG